MKLSLPYEQIAQFCRKWNVSEFALFGSVLRDDFRADSDVDVLVTFRPESRVSLFDFPGMQDELEAIFGRRVDLLTRRGVEESRNPYRKKSILDSAEVVYAAA
ncbi:nucleotidyltransferase family protein [Longimicrobium sp.]|uniref:nucleotidyltransferase family protein n=1 Tax=Longimicrobium sp. TaxID=2029185 RepID=UPI003B3AFE9E